jgi:hypothetical protein
LLLETGPPYTIVIHLEAGGVSGTGGISGRGKRDESCIVEVVLGDKEM